MIGCMMVLSKDAYRSIRPVPVLSQDLPNFQDDLLPRVEIDVSCQGWRSPDFVAKKTDHFWNF